MIMSPFFVLLLIYGLVIGLIFFIDFLSRTISNVRIVSQFWTHQNFSEPKFQIVFSLEGKLLAGFCLIAFTHFFTKWGGI